MRSGSRRHDLLGSRIGRAVFAFAFYFAEGVPIGFIWWALPTLLRKNGESIEVIGTVIALLTLPWVFKFLWAPLVDVFRSARFGFISWITCSQILMCLSLVPLVFVPLAGNTIFWCACLFLHSVCAATQDVSVDALVIRTTAQSEKGMLNGFMQAGMLTGRSLFGGGALLVLTMAGLSLIIAIMIAAICAVSVLLFFAKEPVLLPHFDKSPRIVFKKNIRRVFLRSGTWYAILFALTGAAAFEAVGAMTGPFLSDKGADVQNIGVFFGFYAVIAMLLGGLIGGFLSDRFGRKRSVAVFLTGMVLTVALIALTDLFIPHVPYAVQIAMFTLMFFFTGMFTSSSYALFMEATEPGIGATQFSTFMAATNACESWVVWASGSFAALYGYSATFLTMCLVSLLGLFFLSRIRTAQKVSTDSI